MKQDLLKLNKEVLSNVKGIYGVLEVINSGSVFEIPKETLEEIKRIVIEKDIKKLFFEAHWCYRKRLKEIEAQLEKEQMKKQMLNLQTIFWILTKETPFI